MPYDPPPAAGHRRVFLELHVRDDERGGRPRRVDVPLDIPMPAAGSLDDVPAGDLLAIITRALGT